MLADSAYSILTSSWADALELMVNQAIEEGWEPIGGVAVCYNSNAKYEEYSFYQAMIRRTNKSEELPETRLIRGD